MRLLLLTLLLSVLPVTTHAAIVRQDMRPGIPATAEYLIGERSKPAVLLLHGFLQTREFATVATLSRSLQDAGYTVLLPTLSLNIPNRSQSLACEAVHKHSLDDDLAEIDRWVSWLKMHGQRNIVLVGHSFGSLQLLMYLNSHPDPAIKGYIGASLIEAQVPVPRAGLISGLEAAIAAGQHRLVTGSLSFCRHYASTPEGLLSYVRIDQPRLLAALKQAPVRTLLIMGDGDTIIGRGWLKALQHIRTPMVIVRGASHFMDGEHEFDLQDNVLAFLATLSQAPAR